MFGKKKEDIKQAEDRTEVVEMRADKTRPQVNAPVPPPPQPPKTAADNYWEEFTFEYGRFFKYEEAIRMTQGDRDTLLLNMLYACYCELRQIRESQK